MQHATATKSAATTRTAGAAVSPKSAGPLANELLALQRTIGNTALNRHIQAKRRVSPPNDPLELEADAAAEEALHQGGACHCGGTCRSCASKRVHRKPITTTAGSGFDVPDGLLTGLGAGRPLEYGLRSFFETRFARDFGSVRIHTDRHAAASARAVDALAYTDGHNIVFGAGQYAPDSESGRKLLAHELAHVVQQTDDADAAGVIQRQGDPGLDPGPVTSVRISCNDMHIVFTTPRQAYGYSLTTCQVPLGTYDVGVSVTRNNVRWDFGTAFGGRRLFFGYAVRPNQVNPARLFRGQARVTIEVVESLPTAEPAQTDLTTIADLATRVARFKQLVKTAGLIRMRQNRLALAQWQQFLVFRLTPAQVQAQAQGQEAEEVIAAGERTGGLRASEEWLHTPGPARRWVLRQQAEGRYRACTGCHAMVQASGMDYARELAEGRQRPTPLELLDIAAEGERRSPAARPEFAPAPPPAVSSERYPGYPGVTQAARRIEEIRPFLRQLGPDGYKVLPSEVMGSTATPEQLMEDINRRIAQRQADYLEFMRRIQLPNFDYLDLRPIVRDLLPTADADVRQVVEDEIASARAWEIVENIVIGIATIALLILTIFPPTTALGVAGVLTLGALVSAHQIYRGVQSYEQGQTWSLATGAHDVLDPEQQQAADMMMAMGVLNIVLGAVGLASAGLGGVRLIRGTPPASGQLGALEGVEANAGGNSVRVTGLNTTNPNVRVTSPSGQVIHDGPGTALAQRGPWTPRVIQGGGGGTARATAPPARAPQAAAPSSVGQTYESGAATARALQPAPDVAPVVTPAPAPRHLQVVPEPAAVPAPAPVAPPAPAPATVPAPVAPAVPGVPPTILAPVPGVVGDIEARRRAGAQPSARTTPAPSTGAAPQPATQRADEPRQPQPCPRGTVEILWPPAVWRATGRQDSGAINGVYDRPPTRIVTKIVSPARNRTIIGQYVGNNWAALQAYYPRNAPVLGNIHHKWPLYLEGPDTLNNLVFLTWAEHTAWHSALSTQTTGPVGTRYCIVN